MPWQRDAFSVPSNRILLAYIIVPWTPQREYTQTEGRGRQRAGEGMRAHDRAGASPSEWHTPRGKSLRAARHGGHAARHLATRDRQHGTGCIPPQPYATHLAVARTIQVVALEHVHAGLARRVLCPAHSPLDGVGALAVHPPVFKFACHATPPPSFVERETRFRPAGRAPPVPDFPAGQPSMRSCGRQTARTSGHRQTSPQACVAYAIGQPLRAYAPGATPRCGAAAQTRLDAPTRLDI